MIDEVTMSDPSELSPRAAIALMSLRLRSTVQEAMDAEAEADAVDVDAALWQLRSRLAPLIEDRRRALDEEVAAERERAAAQIAAAHAEADRIVAAAVEAAAARVAAEEAARVAAEEAALVAAEEAARVAAEAEDALVVADNTAARIDDEEAAGTDDEHAVAPARIEPEAGVPIAVPLYPMAELLDAVQETDTPLFDDPMAEWPTDEPVEAASAADAPPTSPATLLMPGIEPLVPPPPSLPAISPWAAPNVTHPERPSMQIVIDAESFARVFAAAIAPALENRQTSHQQLPQTWMPYQAPAPKKSFWSHAWHPDVLLSGLAMVIVIIVLIAWTG